VRKTIFDKLVNDEDDFTELFCNMLKFKEFEAIISDYLGLKNKEVSVDSQYRTKKNGRPDLVISYDDGIEFIEVKVGDRKLTKNQPEGYIKELSAKNEQNKKLYFIIPKNYYYINDLKNRINQIKEIGIPIQIKYWEEFFEYCKLKKLYSRDKVFYEYYSLLKSWFGYETVHFTKEEQKVMKENGKIMHKAGKWLDSISSLLEQKGYAPEWSDGLYEIGIYINKKDIYYGWVGIWFSLWENTGDCFIYTISNKDKKKFYNNFINIYKNCKTYEEREDDKPEGITISKYVCFDDYVFNKNNDESIVFKELLEILNNINKGQK
jgi:hypothetical protein